MGGFNNTITTGASIYKIAFGDLLNGGIQQHHHNRIVILQDCLRRSCKWGEPKQKILAHVVRLGFLSGPCIKPAA
jgi:hypothetical protein